MKKSTVLAYLMFLVMGVSATFISAVDMRGKIDLQVGRRPGSAAARGAPAAW